MNRTAIAAIVAATILAVTSAHSQAIVVGRDQAANVQLAARDRIANFVIPGLPGR